MHGRRAEAAVAPNGVPPRGAVGGEGEKGVEHEERIVKMKLKIIQNALSVISFEWTPTPLPTLLLPLPLLGAFGDRLVWVWFF